MVTQQIVSEGTLPLTDDIRNFLLGTSEYANDIKSDIDLFVTKGRFNEASVRHNLDPIVKSVWRTENPVALLFKDVATFDAQNPIIGSLLREIDLSKKGRNSDLINKQLDKAPSINDTILIQRLRKLKVAPINFNSGNDDDDDNNKPNFPAGQPPPPPTFNDFPDFQAPPTIPSQTIFNQPSIFSQQQPKNTFNRIESAPIAPGEQVMSEIERVAEKAKHEEEVEQITPADPLLEYFNTADEILKTDFIRQKEQEKEELENFKKEYQINTLTDQIDSGENPEILEFYFGGENKNFLEKICNLKPNQEMVFFIDFLMTDFGSRLMKENNLSIHIETGYLL